MKTYAELYADAEKAGKTRSLMPTFVKLDKKGETLVGRYLSREEVKAQAGTGTFYVYIFETDAGLIKTKFGGASDREWGATLEVDGIYRIVFKGKERLPNGQSINRFEAAQLVIDEPTEE